MGLILVAIFQHAPIAQDIPYSLNEDKMHSLFATIVGFSFTIFAISASFIERTNIKRIIALLVGLIAISLSILMFSVIDFAGLWQRLMFIISFAWLIVFIEGMRNEGRKN